MKILLDADALMNAAIAKANEGNISQALKLFAKVNSYESLLNQVGCLSDLRDFTYAHSVYAKLLSKFFEQYDCMSDLFLTGDSAEPIRTYFRSEPTYARPVNNRNKRKAREELICSYGALEIGPLGFQSEDDVDEYFRKFGNYLSEPPAQTFFDVTSLEYFDEQYERLRKSFIRGDMTEYNVRKNNVLNFSNDNSYTLKMKMITCYVDDDYERGMQFVRRLLQLSDASQEALDTAARFLSGTENPEYKELLHSVLSRLTEFTEQTEYDNLHNYLQLSLTNLRDDGLSLKFALSLFSSEEDLSVLSLRLCAVGLYNGGEIELSKQALREILTYMPDNAFALTLLDYISKDNAVKPLHFLNSIGLPYDTPVETAAYCQTELSTRSTQDGAYFSDRIYTLIDLLYDAYRAAALSRNYERAHELSNCVIGAVARLNIRDVADYETFARAKLAEIIPEPSINAALLSKLIGTGFDKTVIVTVEDDTYILDLSSVKSTDSLFIEALSLCAILRKISVRALANAYKTLLGVWSGGAEVTREMVRQVAYCLLSLGYKGFSESKTADYFSDDDRALYNRLFAKLPNN